MGKQRHRGNVVPRLLAELEVCLGPCTGSRLFSPRVSSIQLLFVGTCWDRMPFGAPSKPEDRTVQRYTLS